MKTRNLNPAADAFYSKARPWHEEMLLLREILLSGTLTEEMKWGKPCYTFQGHNVVILIPMKEHCALMFFKGSLIRDDHGILVLPGEESQSGRQVRFTGTEEIRANETLLKDLLAQAVAIEKSGQKVVFKKPSAFSIPEEFKLRLEENPVLKSAFEALTPGRQRAYLLYFAAAKQSPTRISRIKKCEPLILQGKGLNDR